MPRSSAPRFAKEFAKIRSKKPLPARQTSTHVKSHRTIDTVDYLMAASALELDAELKTTNVRHFPMLAGLRPAYRLKRR